MALLVSTETMMYLRGAYVLQSRQPAPCYNIMLCAPGIYYPRLHAQLFYAWRPMAAVHSAPSELQ